MFNTTPPATPPATQHIDPTATPPDDVLGRRRGRVMLFAVAAAAVTIDAASKAWASSSLPGDPMSLGPLTLRLVHNRGVAFGVGAFLPSGALIAVTAVVAVVIVVAAWRGRLDPPVAAGLIVGGAVANISDRLTAGSVVDFIDIGRWPVFNLADVTLLTGIGLLVFANRGRPGAAPPGIGDDPDAEAPLPSGTPHKG